MRYNKLEARKIIKNLQLPKALIRSKSLALTQMIKELSEYKKAKKIAIYLSMEHEFDTSFLLQDKTKTFFVPKIDNGMQFYLYDGQLKQGQYGILEPVQSEIINPSNIDLMIVPYLGFNQRGFRLGHGKGYYDKYLENTNFTTVLAGFEEYLIDFKEESFDQNIDIILIY